MTDTKLSGIIVSDFNADILRAFLGNLAEKPACVIYPTPFGQTIPYLREQSDPVWSKSLDFAVVWTQAHMSIPSFHKALRFEQISEEKLLSECDMFIESIKKAASRVRFMFVVSWFLPEFFRGYGPIDLRAGKGCRYFLLALNQRLARGLSDVPNVYLLDGERWMRSVGEKASDPRLWFLSKIPFDQQVFKFAAMDIKAALTACLGASRKLVILDLDNTLWGGVVGEDGWENLKIGGHDPQGEAFAEFQRVLKSYKERGIVLAVVSKNEDKTAMEVFDRNPEMVLKRDDISLWRINWNDKVENIVDLLKILNLTPQSAVFIDDHPAERDRVRKALPDVLVPEWPDNVLLYPKTFLSLSCFDTVFVSDDDRKRSQMYSEEQSRQATRLNISTTEEWLQSLHTEVDISVLSKSDLPRAAQLLNKTNQMNLSTRRLSEDEFWSWSNAEGRRTWTFRVKDDLGDSGLTGIVSLEKDNGNVRIVDFILSCRVFGRKIEDVMAATIVDQAKAWGIEEIKAQYLPTDKNKPCLDFFSGRTGFSKDNQNSFVWKTKREYPFPTGLKINVTNP